MNKIEPQAYVLNKKTHTLKIVNKDSLHSYLMGVDSKLLSKSYKEIVEALKFSKMDKVEVYYYHISYSDLTLLVSFNKTYQQVANLFQIKLKKFDRTYNGGGHYRKRPLTEVLDAPKTTLHIEVPITLSLDYNISGGYESEDGDDAWMDSYIKVELSDIDTKMLEKPVLQEITKYIGKHTKVKINRMNCGGTTAVNIPSNISFE